MTVHVIMPVFNRLDMTRSMLACLHAQVLDEALHITVVDDGSVDGTSNFLTTQSGVTTVQGNGSLWWGGGINLGLQEVFRTAAQTDWVLFVNNDTTIHQDFVQTLLDAARTHPRSAVGSVIRDISPPHKLLSVGPTINAWRLLISDKLIGQESSYANKTGVVEVDALSGRGVIFPLAALKSVGGMRPRRLPHYLADYEVSLRLKASGWALLVDTTAAVYSKEEYGNAHRAGDIKGRLFSVRSPTYLPALLTFWWGASNWPQRITFPIRALAFALFPSLRRNV